MKLSKSKLALAKVINENGGWHGNDTWLFSTQSGDGVLKFWKAKPKAQKGCVCTEWSGGCRLNFALSRVIQSWHQTILSREEYYQAYPKADADGWIEWNGLDIAPVKNGVEIDIKFRDGDVSTVFNPAFMRWSHHESASDITAYRLHNPEINPEFCESVTRSIPEPELEDTESRLAEALELVKACAPQLLSDKYRFNGDEVMGERKPTIEQLAQDYRNANDYAVRLQKDAGEAAVKAEEFAVEIRKKILEIQELIG